MGIMRSRLAPPLLLVAALTSCGPAGDLPLVQGPSYVVIFPEDRAADMGPFHLDEAGYWTPGAADVAEVESQLREALQSVRRDPTRIEPEAKGEAGRSEYLSRQAGSVLERLERYRRQYLGLVMPDGTRRLLLNCFPDGTGEAEDPYPTWRQEWITVEDGGSDYWRIQYDLGSRRFTGFETNGEA